MLQQNRFFTSDWLTKQLWQFERYLMPLAGTPCQLLEVGCYEGRTTCWLLDNVVRHPDAQLTALDIYEQPVFAANVATCDARRQLKLIEGYSRDTLKTLAGPASFDFIYIDGGHGTVDVIEDAVLTFRLAKVGAVIAFDDYKWRNREKKEEGRPKEAIDAFLKIYSPKIKILNKGYQVWVRKFAE
jgi:predicted O-methyltransferase YrrM